jgi:hypothetical protein
MDAGMTRGERNHNPANIEWNERTPWLGQVPDFERTDARFCQFDDDLHGIRALCRVLLTYQRKDGCKTLEDIVNRFAPPDENDTDAYLNDVSERSGIAAHVLLNLEDQANLVAVANAIISHENGRNPYPPELVTQAAQLAYA